MILKVPLKSKEILGLTGTSYPAPKAKVNSVELALNEPPPKLNPATLIEGVSTEVEKKLNPSCPIP